MLRESFAGSWSVSCWSSSELRPSVLTVSDAATDLKIHGSIWSSCSYRFLVALACPGTHVNIVIDGDTEWIWSLSLALLAGLTEWKAGRDYVEATSSYKPREIDIDSQRNITAIKLMLPLSPLSCQSNVASKLHIFWKHARSKTR
jgi:hypothetical protein